MVATEPGKLGRFPFLREISENPEKSGKSQGIIFGLCLS